VSEQKLLRKETPLAIGTLSFRLAAFGRTQFRSPASVRLSNSRIYGDGIPVFDF
jgi:hypothetical protein